MDTLKSIVLLFLLLLCGFSEAQDQPKHEKKVYISPEGRMYINKALPVYLWLSTSPDANAPSYLLKSEATAKYANPMYFDTEGYNTFRSPSAVDTATKQPLYPQEDIIFEVYADSRPPVTKIQLGKSKTYIKSGKTYINAESSVTFTSYDETSGVENIFFSINGEPYKVYDKPLALTEEKEYIIRYYAVDHVGNTEKLKTITIVFDKTSPKTKISITGDYYINILSGRSKLELLAEDNSSGVNKIIYQLDDNPQKTYLYPFNLALLSQGEHKLTYFGIDHVENTEEVHEYEFYVDKTPPTIMQEITGKTFFANGREFSSGRAQLKLTTFDNKAGVKEVYYSINNQEFKLYEKPVYLVTASGNISIRSYALDNVNNRCDYNESNTQTKVPFIDLSGPAVNHSFKGPFFILGDSVFISPATSIQLKAADADAGLNYIEYHIDNNESITYNQPFQVHIEGYHKIFATAYDNVENSTNYEFSVIVDKKGPEIFERFSTLPVSKQNHGKNLDIYPPHVVVFISATDNQSGFDKFTISINNQPEKPFNGTISSLNKQGDYNIIIKAFDKLGNFSTSTLEFAIGL